MRFIRSFLLLFAFILVVIVFGFLLTREYFMYQGTQTFKRSVASLNTAGKTAAKECHEKSEFAGDTLLDDITYQLRFTSDKDYVLEVICGEFSFDPVLVGEYSLEPFITKRPGTSGIVLNQGRSAVELVVFADIVADLEEISGLDLSFLTEEKIVGVDNSYVTEISTDDDLGVGPITSCEGYGFQCCDAVSQIGLGEKREGVKGCENSCYQACSSRPTVLSFTSNPFFEVETRQVNIQPGEIIDFNYVVEPGPTNDITVTIDFGDGKTETLAERTGSTSHSYSCSATSCSYDAIITVADGDGEQSVVTSISKIKVVVGAMPTDIQAEVKID